MPMADVHNVHMPKNKKPPSVVRHYFRQRREEGNLSQEQLAERITEKTRGISRASISRIESGKQTYRSDVLEAMADILTNGDIRKLFERPQKGP